MTVISIRERNGPSGANATISFDDLGEYSVTVGPPFSDEEERRLEWYFEQHLRFPFTEQVRAREAAASISAYGERLFDQVFANRQAFARYSAALQAGANSLAFEIAGAPEFHRLHWEALKDPALPRAFALEGSMVRKNLEPQTIQANVRPSPTINLLVVTARPEGGRDVGYRTISRPLVEALRRSNVPVQVEILRPGTYQALDTHLREVAARHGAGYYHVVHFDVHGAVLTYEQLQRGIQADRYVYQARYGRGDIEPYQGHKAFLFFEGERDVPADPVEAGELANLLITHQAPIAVLNACQSGKQIGASETSLGSRLMQAGVQLVLAMGYSVTVSAAELLMRTLYEQLFAGHSLATAISQARCELYNRKGRRGYFNQTIDLEDWLLPVVYQNQPLRLDVRPFTPEEQAAYYGREAARYPFPQPSYGFVGRDLDILQIEKRLLARRNLLLVRGMGGAGKTTLLRHLGAWWQTTRFVEQVFEFGYDEKAWTRQQIMAGIAQRLLSPAEYHGAFVSLGLDAQQALLAQRLRANRHLLILDNLESITGAQLAIQHTLPAEEQAALRGFLADLADGRTLVLLGSRGGEDWLAAGTFGDNVYELPGLDPEAASTLAERILERYDVAKYRAAPEFRQLLKLLDGYPLALEVVLANLARQTAAEVLAALRAGNVALDSGDSQDKTASILCCIDYSHSNLSPDAQGLLVCLAPFTSALFEGALERYTEHLRQQPALAGLPYERWTEVLREAANWGLLSPHPDARGFLILQPILPYFLRSRLNAPEQAGVRRAVETAFRLFYDQYGKEMANLLQSKEAREKQLGQAFARLEYENLVTALDLSLAAQASLYNIYGCLTNYLDTTRNHQLGVALGQHVLNWSKGVSIKDLPESFGIELARVFGDVGNREYFLRLYAEAEASYHQCLLLVEQIKTPDPKIKAELEAITYHQLGMLAKEQRQWAQAEQHYQQALQICIEFDDHYSQARTYHQLGMVAQEQRQWAQAEQHYQRALQIYGEFGDRYSQARTYHQLGRVAQEQNQWTQAEQHYQQALQIFVEFADRYSQAQTLHALGGVFQEQRRLGEAEENYKQALQIYIEFNDRYWQAGAYHQLGMVAEEQRQWAQAEQYYQQALQIKIEFDDRYSQASTYHQLGMVAEEQRQWAQARDYFLRALEIAVEFNDEYRIGTRFGSLARLWQASGDTDLPAAVAAVLGATPEEVEEEFRRRWRGIDAGAW